MRREIALVGYQGWCSSGGRVLTAINADWSEATGSRQALQLATIIADILATVVHTAPVVDARTGEICFDLALVRTLQQKTLGCPQGNKARFGRDAILRMNRA